MRAAAVILVAVSAAAHADDTAVAQAWERAQSGDAQAVRELAGALHDAQLSRTANVALAALAQQGNTAARDELIARAAQDPSISLMALEGGQKLPAELALRVAREHLERALRLSPIQEGEAFTAIAQTDGPQLTQASQETPLDPELAKEMGAQPAKPEVQPAQPAPEEPVQGKQAKIELDRARALAASVDAPEGHEVAGLAALAQGDTDGAEKEFLQVVAVRVNKHDEPAVERRDRAFLQLARLAYQRGDDQRATQLYEKVGRGAPEWLDALFEASWAHFRRGQDEHALGNLLTLHAPFFQGRFFPESFVLKALVLYENCRYPEARAALVELQKRYEPLHDGLAEVLQKLTNAQTAYELLAAGPTQVEQSVPLAARAEVGRLEHEPELAASVKAVQELAQEIDSVDRRSPAFRGSSFARTVIPLAQKTRLALLETTGARFAARLQSERAELRELLGQSLRLSYEIAGREKDLAAQPDDGLMPAPQSKEPPQVDEDEVLWPFQGEYWRDELGSYRFQLGQRCKRPRPAPMQAQEPAQPAPQAAAGH